MENLPLGTATRYDLEMLFVHRRALPPIPKEAEIPEHVVLNVSAGLMPNGPSLRRLLDDAFARMERKQPVMAGRVTAWAEGVGGDPQSIGYFLLVTCFLMFDEAFPRALMPVSPAALSTWRISIDEDERMRPDVMPEDLLWHAQPHLMAFLEDHLRTMQSGLEDGPLSPDLVAAVLRSLHDELLLWVTAFSHAVRSVTQPAATYS